MYHYNKLSNSLPVIVEELPAFNSATVLILVKAGSRYEKESEKGLSHFLEHMFFKGGEKYKNAKEVSTIVDSIGGDFNAFTGKEYAGYYVKCATEHLNIAYDLLSDMLITATLKDEEINKERGVILEELNMYQDTPMYQASWDFEEFLLGDQALGWDTIGDKKVIKKLNSQDFKNYKNSLYTPDNLVLAVSGGISKDKVFNDLEKYFSRFTGKKNREFINYQKKLPNKKVKIHHKNTEQSHFVFGGLGLKAKDKDIYTEKLLSIICGGMMSSRMFLSVREEQGLCYYISTSTDDFMDVGLISTRAGVDNKRFYQAVSSVFTEYQKLTKEEVSEEELIKAKNFLIGKMKLRMEDSEAVSHMLGKQALLYDEILTLEEVKKEVLKVTKKDILSLAQKLFAKENLYLTAIGPLEDQVEKLENLLN
jgi:predicted Zn-dependent peptidase